MIQQQLPKDHEQLIVPVISEAPVLATSRLHAGMWEYVRVLVAWCVDVPLWEALVTLVVVICPAQGVHQS